MARLYPPVTEEVLPAFCLSYNEKGEKTGASININFNLNRAVANAEIAGIALRLRTISTNQYVITESLRENSNTGKSEGVALSYSLEDGTCTFVITSTNNPDAVNLLKVGQYYKAQLAFIGLTGTVGYWSTVATIKCVAKPTVTIANYTPNDANIFTNEILGEYTQDTSTGDSTEKVYSYRFQLFDNSNNLLDDTGVCLHNSSSDVASNSSTDTYRCYRELNINESYYIIYSVTTINGLSISSPKYQIITTESVDPEDDITLLVSNGLEENIYNSGIPTGGFPSWEPWEEGLVKIVPDLESNVNRHVNISGERKAITGNYIILRSSSKDNFMTWQEIRRFRLVGEVPSDKVIYDYTVEQGVSYRYAIQQYNRQKFYSKKIYAYKRDSAGAILHENSLPVFNDIKADFEDMFLYDGERQLKIRFNPKVSSFKNDLQEQKIDTIGSKHPFIFRNGNVCYKEFPIAGLISFQQDNVGLFFNDEDYKQMNLARFEGEDKRDPRTSIKYIGLSASEAIYSINNNIQLYKQEEYIKDSVKISGHEILKDQYKKQDSYYTFVPVTSSAEATALITNNIQLYKKIEEKVERLSNGMLNHFDQKDYKDPQFYNKTDLTSENIMSERYFKLLVLDWLTDGKPKLFRSPTEGNYIVRLLNVSLTPKTELGRMIHEFTCTAYEVADFNYQSLVDFGLLKSEEINEIEKSWYTKLIKDITKPENKTKDGYYNLDLENKILTGFQAIGFAPGDKLHIMVAGEATPMEITIGTTGTYIYDGGKNIISISFLPQNDTGGFSRSVLLTTQGYASQKFDTIASIATYTQMGEQLVGPVQDFLKQTVVGQGNKYYTSPNVLLDEDGGEKLRVSEILHLKARKREVIPIFYNPDSSQTGTNDIVYDSQNNIAPTFSLTPFGQGYIQGKSIMPKSGRNKFNTAYNIPWGVGLGNLSEDELREKRTIKDLVDFVITKCNKDIFCLFEVYLPEKGTNNKYTWAPYSTHTFSAGTPESVNDNWGTKIYGIYDPWLYEQQSHLMSKTAQDNYWFQMGWWPKKPLENGEVITVLSDYGLYNPTITFTYGNKEIVIDLNETGDLDIDNVKVPDSITLGNGVMMEPIYRLQYIDYTIENEDSQLKKLKDNYLMKKEEAQYHILQYRMAENSTARGIVLSQKYNAELEKIRDYENYRSIIEILTRNARNEQIKKLQKYFITEKSLVNGLISQLTLTELEFIEQICDIYTTNNVDYHLITSVIDPTKQLYDNFFENEEKFLAPDENFEPGEKVPKIYDLSEVYNKYHNNTSNTRSGATSNINNFIKHSSYSTSNHNFSVKIDQIKNYIQRNIDNISESSQELGHRTYVSQYLELLNSEGKNIFFSKIGNKILKHDGEYNYSDDMAYKLFSKQPLDTDERLRYLQNFAINNPIWNTYFYLDRNKPLASLKLNNATRSNNFYSIDNLNLYRAIFVPTLTYQGAKKYYYFNTSNNSFREVEENHGEIDNEADFNNKIVEKYLLFTTVSKDSNGFNIDNTSLVGRSNGQMILNINQQLAEVNLGHIKGGNKDSQKASYNEKWAPAVYAEGTPPPALEEFKLGVVDVDDQTGKYIIKKELHTLETIIDSIYLQNPNATVRDIIVEIKEKAFVSSLPDAIKTINGTGSWSLLDWYIQKYLTFNTSLNASFRDIYQKIVACISYRDTHINELTEEQKNIIENTIKDYLNEEKSNEPTKLINFNTNENEYFQRLKELLNEWRRDYNNIHDTPDNFETLLTNLNNSIADYNNLVTYENTICSQFMDYQERYEQASTLSMSTNIKEILQEEVNIYSNVLNSLNEIQSIYNTQLKNSQNNVLLEGYLDFLVSYVNEFNISANVNNKNTYIQLLEQAQAMANAKNSIPAEYNPFTQKEIVTQAWKTYLDALAQVYKKEIKERFG